jgi:hypothetical protein
MGVSHKIVGNHIRIRKVIQVPQHWTGSMARRTNRSGNFVLWKFYTDETGKKGNNNPILSYELGDKKAMLRKNCKGCQSATFWVSNPLISNLHTPNGRTVIPVPLLPVWAVWYAAGHARVHLLVLLVWSPVTATGKTVREKDNLRSPHESSRCLTTVPTGSIADPDPQDHYVFGPPGTGSGSISTRYGSGSVPKCHRSPTLHANKVL